MRALKRSSVAGHRTLTRTNWEQSSKLIFLQLHEKLPKNSMLTRLWLFSIWSKLERWKSLISGCLMTWPQIKKVFILKCHLLLLYTIVSLSDCDVQWKSGLFMTPGDDQLNGWTKKKLQSTSQSQTCTKKGHGHCLVVSCPSGPLDLFESLQNHYIWEVCSANRWDASKTATPSASKKGPNSSPWQCPTTHHITNTSKDEWIGLWSFASSTIFM